MFLSMKLYGFVPTSGTWKMMKKKLQSNSVIAIMDVTKRSEEILSPSYVYEHLTTKISGF
jgi:hypothetical protein